MGPLLDDVNDAAGCRIDKHRAIVDDGVAIVRLIILARNLVIGHAVRRQNCTDAHIFAIGIRRATLFDDIRAKARTIIDAQHAGNAADHTTNGAADNRADRTCGALTVACATLDAAGNTLRLGENGNRKSGDEGGSAKEMADNVILLMS